MPARVNVLRAVARRRYNHLCCVSYAIGAADLSFFVVDSRDDSADYTGFVCFDLTCPFVGIRVRN